MEVIRSILFAERPGVWNGTLIDRITRECWKQHPSDCASCDEPACLLAKAMMKLADVDLSLNGVRQPGHDGYKNTTLDLLGVTLPPLEVPRG